MPPTFANLAFLSEIRTKFNDLVSNFLEPGLKAKNVAILLASAAFTYSSGTLKSVSAGDIITTKREGYSYEVVVLGSANYDLATAGGVLLNALPTGAYEYDFECMGPAGDGVTDDYAKLRKLLDKITIEDTIWYVASPKIVFAPKTYYIGQTLELKQTVHLQGSMGHYPNKILASTLLFPEDITGIVVNRYNTDETGEVTATTASDWSTIQGLSIRGSGGTDKTRPGILMRSRAAILSCYVSDFSGNGISIIAGAGVGGAGEGNANLWFVQSVNCSGNGGWGFFVNGADTNAGIAIALDCTRNGRGGIWDSSFLGNTYIATHVATNGVASSGGNSSIQSSFVSYGGNRYAAHWTATEAELVATEPGTDATVWILDGSGGTHPTIPLWTAGRPEGTYFVAFSYYSDGDSSRNKFINGYSEGGAAGSVVLGNSHFDGGILHSVYAGGQLNSTQGGVRWNAGGFDSANAAFSFSMTGTVGAYSFSSLSEPGIDYWAMQYANGNFQLQNRNSSSRRAYYLTNENTNERFKFKFGFQDYLMGSPGSAQYRGIGTAAPTTGTWARGDRVENSAPSAGGWSGWICTTAGTPGTWKGYGVIEA